MQVLCKASKIQTIPILAQQLAKILTSIVLNVLNVHLSHYTSHCTFLRLCYVMLVLILVFVCLSSQLVKPFLFVCLFVCTRVSGFQSCLNLFCILMLE